MRNEKAFSVLWSALLSFCIAFGSVCCLITAFALPVELFKLAVYTGVFALFASLLSLIKRGNWIVALAVAAVGGLLWHRGALADSVETLLYNISLVYDRAYGFGVLYWSDQPPAGGTEALALGLGVTVIAWGCAYTVMCRQPSICALALALSPLFACMVVTDTVPSSGSLLVLVFGIVLLVLTQTVRRRAVAEGNRLTAILLIPALLASLLLFWAVPQEGYQQPQSIPGWLQGIYQQISTGGESVSGVPSDKVDLGNLGPKADIQYAVMEITAQQGGLFYLRGQSFDVYTGTSWEISSYAIGPDNYFPTGGLRDAGVVTVHLRMDTDRQYLPYYTARMSELQYGRYENTGGRTYNLQRMVPDAGGAKLLQTVVEDDLVKQCLALPDQTRAWAEAYLKNIPLGSSHSDGEKAQIITEFVKVSALYDKKTAKMPQEKTDFVQWFMEEGETGYCVHFATAATVLLRAAGIPARYVSGYMTEVGSTKTNVLADESHAWVEYLDYSSGWTLLDPTPAEPEPGPTEPSTEPVTQPTQQETTQPTQQGSTRPTENTTLTEETTQPATEPFIDGSGEKKDDMILLRALIYACLAVAAVWGQYVLRLKRRRQKRSKGGPNRRALTMWKEIVRFSRLYRLPLSEELLALAEKAKFSQHTLSDPELGQFRTGLQDLRRHLGEKPWYKRLLLKLIFAAE